MIFGLGNNRQTDDILKRAAEPLFKSRSYKFSTHSKPHVKKVGRYWRVEFPAYHKHVYFASWSDAVLAATTGQWT